MDIICIPFVQQIAKVNVLLQIYKQCLTMFEMEGQMLEDYMSAILLCSIQLKIESGVTAETNSGTSQLFI